MPDVVVPESATREEAAAIVAAVNAHLAGQTEDVDGGESRSWEGHRWRFGGRMEGLQDRPVRVPRRAPRNEWRASSRTDRF